MASVQEQRDKMHQIIAETGAYQKTIFKKLDRIETHLATQNGRINDLEKSQSLMKGIGITVSIVLSAVIALIKGESS
jgi:tetrahydromethanopterin S-methyltransferase subunit G